MKTALITILFIILNVKAIAQSNSYLTLPKTWDKDFVVRVSYTGGQGGGKAYFRVTYDSLIETRVTKKRGTIEKTYLMTDADRVALLTRFHELNIDDITPSSREQVMPDVVRHSVSFGLHCIEGGETSLLTANEKKNLREASAAIQDLAAGKAK